MTHKTIRKRMHTGRVLLLTALAGATLVDVGARGDVQPDWRSPVDVRAPEARTPASGNEPRARYNAMVLGLRRRLNAADLDDQRAVVAAREFIADTTALPGGISYLSDVIRLHAGMNRVLSGDGELGDEVSKAFVQAGPASTGVWRAESAPGAARGSVEFVPIAPGSRATKLEFQRVEVAQSAGGGMRSIYVLSGPLTVEQAAGAVMARHAEGELRRLMPPVPEAFDARRGPWRWRWTHGGSDRERGLLTPVDDASGALGVQHIPPTVAALLASSVGGRLPTRAEWSAMINAGRGTDSTFGVFLLDGPTEADFPGPTAFNADRVISNHFEGLAIGRASESMPVPLERRGAAYADVGVWPVFDAPGASTGSGSGRSVRARLAALLEPPPLLRVR